MIAGSAATKTPAWALELADAVTEPAELLAILDLPPTETPPSAGFRLRVPRSYVARMRPGDPGDPLLMQVWLDMREVVDIQGYSLDPVGDQAACRASGVLQKYPGRVLLALTGACAVHCRYCFRRHFPYTEANPLGRSWSLTLDNLRAIKDLTEVILSGGDPLTVSDDRLAAITADLEGLAGLARLRLHTRLPIVLPARVDSALCAWIARTRLQVAIVVHANHAQEIDREVRSACRALRDAGAILLNQSVLLRGINDSVSVLADLSEALFAAGVVPYYLHLLDKVAGAAHFDVPEIVARQLYSALAARLPGYLVPRLVREQAGAPSKILIPPA